MRTLSILAGFILFSAPQFAVAQDSTSRAVVQPLPSSEVQRLNRALLELARRPDRVSTLLEAGDAALAVNDYDAAIGFYGRAAESEPENPRVKLGLARVYLRSGRPVEAIPLFNAARSSGAPARDVLSDQALAFDMVGDQTDAQLAYLRAIELNPSDDEARRRLAISYAIAGNEGSFQTTLAPLVEARDVAAIRARAFGLAILGKQERAEGIVNASMPPDLASRINPYLAYMPRLTRSQQAAAANLGIFPRAADIGREDPRIARFASEGAAGSLLEPAGAPLGSPRPDQTQTVAVSPEVAQPVPEPVVQPAPVVAATAQPDPSASATPRPGFDLARSGTAVSNNAALPQIATSQISEPQTVQQTRPALVPQPTRESASVADAFADLGMGELPVAASTGQAVNIAALDIPREVAPEPEPAAPEHPQRIWVQLATGRDVAALRFDWRRLARSAPELLGDFKPHVTPWGQANRLLAGPLDSRADARDLVNALAEKGVDTFSYTSPEGTEIQELR